MPLLSRRKSFGPRFVSRAQRLELLLGPNGETVFPSGAEREQVWAQIRDKLSAPFARQWHIAGGGRLDFAVVAERYARDVVGGGPPACRQVKLACQRHLEDLVRPGWDFEFDVARAERVCRFIELLPHVKGTWAANAERITLTPFQVFILCALFGWVHKATRARRFTLAYIAMPRKNAKSTLAAGAGLYMFACDLEFGSEVYSGATTELQALEVFRPARQMMERSPELARVLGVTVGAKRLFVPEDGSRFEPVVGRPGDGAMPQCGIVDEYHEHDSDALFDTLRTGMGSRLQPLQLVITTAGDNTAGPCKLLEDDVVKILEGLVNREEVFGIVFTLDEGDEWTSDLALEKSNPNLGVSVFPEFLRAERDAAMTNPRKQGVFQTKHLGLWRGSERGYFDVATWKVLGDRLLDPGDLKGQPCVIAVDLATKRDFTARVRTFKQTGRDGKEHYFVFATFYLPELVVQRPENQHYQGWAAQGYLVQQPGATADFEQIVEDTAAEVEQYSAESIVFDPRNASALKRLDGRTGAQMIEIDQSTGNLSAPTKELDALIASGRIHHDGNPVLTWMLGNVVCAEDRNECVFPMKRRGREESKIDGAIAVIMALLRLIAVEETSQYAGVRSVG
jgi:phage terminase large subunit-like protein